MPKAKAPKFPFITVFANFCVHRCKSWRPLITIELTWRMLFAAAAWRRCLTRTASRWSWGRRACRGPGAGPPCCPSVHHNIIIFIILHCRRTTWRMAAPRCAKRQQQLGLATLFFNQLPEGYYLTTIVSMWSFASYLRLHPRCSKECRSCSVECIPCHV